MTDDNVTFDWPDDMNERIDAKLNKLLSNHLPHIEMRLSNLEKAFYDRQRWQFCTGIVTLILILYMVFS